MLSIAQNNDKDRGKSFYTSEEVKQMCGVPVDTIEMKKVLARQDSMYKDYISKKGFHKITTFPNWKGMMSPVENLEPFCNNCWAHAATGIVEGQLHIFLHSNIGIDLDETDIVDNSDHIGSCFYGDFPTPH